MGNPGSGAGIWNSVHREGLAMVSVSIESRLSHYAVAGMTALALLLPSRGGVTAGEYVRVSPDLEIYYEEMGSGTPLIFNPGWTGTTEFFQHLLPHFSDRYRVITYDPRSHGRSSKSLENNTYTQHGADLRAFMEALKLEDVILVAHSWGCLDAYAYFRAYGTDNVKAFVCVDQTPKNVATEEGDWGFLKKDDYDAIKGEMVGVAFERRAMMPGMVGSMVTREVTEDEMSWLIDEVMKTPNHAALQLEVDGMFADYSAEAKMIDGKIPVLNVLSDTDGWTEPAKAWLAANAPNSETFVLGRHMMFWEFPDQFNAALDEFLKEVK
jgi:non-heme chloroperoxidase